MNKGSVFLAALLLTAIFAMLGANDVSYGFADDTISKHDSDTNNTDVTGTSTASTDNSGPPNANRNEVVAASGSNRFVAWADNTPGNYDILFKRSTNNGATFGSVTNLSTSPGNSTYPEIVVSGTNVYVIWRQDNAAETLFDVFFRKSTNNGATWGPKVKISTSGLNLDQPHVAVSGSNVYVVWVDGGSGSRDISFRKSTNNGATWGSIVNVSNNAGASLDPEIAVSGSNVYIVWYDFTTPDSDILFKRSTNNGATFGSALNISNNAGASLDPEIAVSGSNVYIVWYDSTPGNSDILFKRSTNNGATFGSVTNLSTNTGDSSLPEIAVSANNVYVVWKQDNAAGTISDVFFRKSTNNGATWGPKVKISTSGDTFRPGVDASGSNVYVVWPEEGASEISFRRSTNNGATWGPIVNLSNTAGGIEPQMAVSGSNVYVVWSDLSPGNFDILFKRSTNNGATFGSVINISNNAGDSRFGQIAS